MNKLENWDAFGSKYLKAENVTSNTDKYVITAVDFKEEEGKTTLILTVEREEIAKLFGCNVTNEQCVKAVCPVSPKQVIGKVVTFNKVKTNRPGSNVMVDGLRIQFVTEPAVEPKEADTSNAGLDENGKM